MEKDGKQSKCSKICSTILMMNVSTVYLKHIAVPLGSYYIIANVKWRLFMQD